LKCEGMPDQVQIKKASIVSVGNEVLSGRTIDTNAAHVARRLRAVDVPVVSIYVAPDDVEAIKRVLALATADAEVVVISGGLGPTDDDLTRQAIADFLGVELVLHEDLLAKIRQFFDRRGVVMPARNAIQAHIPAWKLRKVEQSCSHYPASPPRWNGCWRRRSCPGFARSQSHRRLLQDV
jgi:molybdenum cofactor synthesis domain-containing protein